MADLNALIAQGAQFKAPPDPFAQYAQMQQLQQGQQANQLNQMKMQEYQRERQSQNALRASAAPAGVNPQHWAIDPQKALALQKTSAEAANLVSTGKKTEGDIRKQLMDFENNAKRDLSQNPSPENIQAYGQDAVLKGFATPEQAAAKVQQYLSMPPDQLVRMLSQAGATAGELLTSESAKLGRATTERGQDIGASTALAGQQSVAATAKAGQGITLRGQNLTNQPPVAVVDPVTGKQVFVSREEALRGRMTPAASMESLPPKEIQKREAAFPQATSSMKGFDAKSDSFIKDLEKLRDDPGLNQITGSVYGRTLSLSREGSRAQSQYNKVFAKGGFQALQDMRDASKTGGALGNVSNQEGERLERSIVGGLDRTQDVEDVKAGITELIDSIKGSKVRMKEAYDMTYDYKQKTPAAGKEDPLGIR